MMVKFEYDPITGQVKKDGVPTGTKNAKGYIVLRKDGKVVYAHRLAWELYHGEAPAVIDHKNGNKSDNRLVNLRSVTQMTNAQNMRPGKGCHFHKPSKSWKSSINLNGKQTHLGYFDSPEDASECYQFAKEFFHNPPVMQSCQSQALQN